MDYTKIMIPKISNNYKLYIYRSKVADDINTISKIKELSPIAVIDEATAKPITVNGKKHYRLLDKLNENVPGVQYFGPAPNSLPLIEYETQIDIVKLNRYTYVNQITFNPLPIKYNGTMFYYSVIGVDEQNNMVTHLSKVNGILIHSHYKNGVQHIYSCDDYQDSPDDQWEYVAAIPWDEKIEIGNMLDKSSYDRYGCPVPSEVNIFKGDDVKASLRPVLMNNFMVLEIPNIWQQNNKTYNYRKLKSYKIQTVYNNQYSEFSVPTYQSLMPVSIEKMIILEKEDTETIPTLDDINDENVKVRQIIRKDGIYYNKSEHKKLGFNKYNIPLEEKLSVFSESSVQDYIKMQIEALPNHVYSFAIYIFDVYGNVSKPATFIVRT